MAQARTSIVVERPVTPVYNQWTQFEDFPQFMEGVEQVVQKDDTHLHWVAKIGPVEREWEAEIVQQVPDETVAWRSTAGAENAGRVTFRPVSAERTEVDLELVFEPEDPTEKAGDALQIVERRAEGDLQRFKEFIESRGEETGAWRGRVKS
ncbi:MAG TPA: SRPBCC family protein [Acidimicrobiales bacterium]|nr:SRPBCC family protein [Acidimicrobiales bacterium]